jgi:hypothetical protein
MFTSSGDLAKGQVPEGSTGRAKMTCGPTALFDQASQLQQTLRLACNQRASGNPGALTSQEEKMRRCLLATALFASLCAVATAGPKEDGLQVLEKWTKAFSASDVDGIVKLYAADTTFLGTGARRLSSSQKRFANPSSKHS